MKFQTNNSLYKLMNLIIYLFLLYLFIDLLMKSGILDEQIDKLSELSNLFTIKYRNNIDSDFCCFHIYSNSY